MTSYADRLLTAFSVVTPRGERVTFQIHKRDYPRWVNNGPGRRSYYTSTRTDYNKKPRMYVGVEESLLENLANRTTRPVNAWGRSIREAMKVAGLEGTIGWYQKAGCSCPCSPGFIWTNAPRLDTGDGYGTTSYDVSVYIAGAPAVRDDEAAQREQLGRLGAIAQDPTLPLEALAGTRL